MAYDYGKRQRMDGNSYGMAPPPKRVCEMLLKVRCESNSDSRSLVSKWILAEFHKSYSFTVVCRLVLVVVMLMCFFVRLHHRGLHKSMEEETTTTIIHHHRRKCPVPGKCNKQ